jgi:hypothetical protein
LGAPPHALLSAQARSQTVRFVRIVCWPAGHWHTNASASPLDDVWQVLPGDAQRLALAAAHGVAVLGTSSHAGVHRPDRPHAIAVADS